MVNTTAEMRGRVRPLVLIVEDQSDLRLLYVEHLTTSGFDVIEAANGAEAIDHTSARMPDVVLMDMVMPGLDGASATRAIREQFPTVQVIALTSFKEEGLIESALQAGAIGYLLKDISADGAKVTPEVFAAVYKAVDGRKLRRASKGFMSLAKDAKPCCECGATLPRRVTKKRKPAPEEGHDK